MLKLLAIALSRSPALLSGDGHSALPVVLERLLPLLARADLAPLHPDVTNRVCQIFGLIHSTAPSLLPSLARGTVALFDGGQGMDRGGQRLHPQALPGQSAAGCLQLSRGQPLLVPPQPCQPVSSSAGSHACSLSATS